MILRQLLEKDIPQLLVIEQAVHVSPWDLPAFKMCFENKCLSWGMEVDKKIIGFVVTIMHTQECHILNLCIVREFQHQGLGRQLLTYALNQVKQRGAVIAFLEVRKSNSRAISLYRKMQFQLVGERKNYYPTVEGHENALVFARSLNEEIL